MKTALLLCLSIASAPLLADTLYKCTEKGSESVLYTNKKVANKQCVVISQGGGESSAGGAKSAASSHPTPGDFPKVSADTQKARDSDRRTILEQEMAEQRKGLEEAKKAANTNKIQHHERNIEALQKELTNLK